MYDKEEKKGKKEEGEGEEKKKQEIVFSVFHGNVCYIGNALRIKKNGRQTYNRFLSCATEKKKKRKVKWKEYPRIYYGEK